MKFPPILRIAPLALALVALSACKREQLSEIQPYPLKDLPGHARQNNLANLPGAVYNHAATSPIHWQPWTPESIGMARETNRMIFAVVAMAQAPGFIECLDSLASDRALVNFINSNYLPILIDGDAVREIALLTADLSLEINQNVNLPFFIWMSPDAHPVAWIASPWVDPETTREHFRRSHSMVSRIWEESPEYVIRNSTMDNESRLARMSQRRLSRVASQQPKLDTVRSIRQLASLYDPLSRNYDDIGGLFPAGALDLMASAAMQPGLPPDAQRRAVETTREFVKDLCGSAMFDPLDGGLFSARRGASWSLPRHSRHSMMQSRAAVALFRAYQATGDPLALERGLGVLNFAEKNHLTRDGLFAIGLSGAIDPRLWLWNIEEVESALGQDEGAWFASLTGMRGLGNIAYEIDPERQFFRTNSLALEKSSADLAVDSGLSPDAFARRLDAARAKLLAVRDQRFGKTPHDDQSHAAASFRMVSAYAAAFTATGDDAWRRKAVELLKRSRDAFSEGPWLRVHAVDAPPAINDARAFVYTIAIQSILDVVDITGDESWLDWSDNLATVLTENFTNHGFLREAAERSSLMDLPMADLIMLFEDSTVGLMNFAECRLAARARPLMRELREFAGTLPVSAVDFPVQHTDIVQSFLARHFPVTVVHGTATSPELMERIERLPIRMFHRRRAADGETLPDNGCLVIRTDAPEAILIRNLGEFEKALLPNRPDR
ncbi:MAG: DUF255 domain-containing protein [Luteolibacter sp.]